MESCRYGAKSEDASFIEVVSLRRSSFAAGLMAAALRHCPDLEVVIVYPSHPELRSALKQTSDRGPP